MDKTPLLLHGNDRNYMGKNPVFPPLPCPWSLYGQDSFIHTLEIMGRTLYFHPCPVLGHYMGKTPLLLHENDRNYLGENPAFALGPSPRWQ